ncbi:MAG: glycoside hydrolase family 16 protein [Ruminococcus sp.]|nr:glycoside hydrolase family 16 protein [Ruminococcus sp.]
MKKYIIGLVCFVMTMSMAACGDTDSSSEDKVSSKPSSASAADTAAPVEDSPYDMLADFENGASEKFIPSDGWTNGSPFDCTWKSDNVTFENSAMQLRIDETYEYTGGEYRSNDFYGYGLYEVSMKPIKNIGVVSSFFTYTGPSDGNPWDEIDIEFLGKDTTKVQFNYYTDGTGGHEYLYDLGFDAAEEFHEYGFEWKTDSITWYVDGEAVYTATENLPSTPGKLMMNAWNGKGVDGWLGKFDGTVPLTAEYKWARFTAEK